MGEVFPISCVLCRLKKIRCNKQNPCNQCNKRNIPCHFPATFRNRKINEYDFNYDDFYVDNRRTYGHDVRHNHPNAKYPEIKEDPDASKYPQELTPQVPQIPGSHTLTGSSGLSLQYPQVFHYNDYNNRERNSHMQSVPQGQQMSPTYMSGGVDPSPGTIPGPIPGNLGINSELENVRNENNVLLQEVMKLNSQVALLSRQVALKTQDDLKSRQYQMQNSLQQTHKSSFSQDDSQMHSDDIHTSIKGETSEGGEKYYGPQSLTFMIENMNKQKSEETNKDQSGTPSSSTGKSSLPSQGERSNPPTRKSNKLVGYTDFMENTSASSDSKFTLDLDHSNSTVFPGKDMIEQSLNKKQLPVLLLLLLRLGDPDMTADSDTAQDLYKLNFKLIYKLVELFFKVDPYYETFINKTKVFAFLEGHEKIRDKEWENDDDLLLFYMILLFLIQRLSPSDFLELNLLLLSTIHNYDKLKSYLCKNVLFHSFEKLRHNMINESVLTIQAYILATEYHFTLRRYEECWSMMFHCCSIAYSIGLHVMGQFRSVESTSEKDHALNEIVPKKETLDNVNENCKGDLTITENDEDDIDTTRFRVFFALKNVTGQICSILGRPNPISIQVNSVVLKSTTVQDSIKELNANETQVLLKIGLSECLRLSNSMLIENFMIDFTTKDLFNLRQKFATAINLLEQYHDRKTKVNDDALKISRINVLKDLIILHINNAKLTEPFINKFKDKKEYNDIIKGLLHSIFLFLDLINEFIKDFFRAWKMSSANKLLEVPNGGASDSTTRNISKYNLQAREKGTNNESGGILNTSFCIGKLFRALHPFLNSFIYQGIIVIFTFLHYRFDDFVKNGDSKNQTLNNKVLSRIEKKLKEFLKRDNDAAADPTSNSKFWSSNISYLMKKILHHINIIHRKQRGESDEEINRKKRKFEETHSDGSDESSPDTKTSPNLERNKRASGGRGGIHSEKQKRFNQKTDILDQSEPKQDILGKDHSNNPDHGNLRQSYHDLDILYGLRVEDPFWITNPDNLPYYLSSPSDDGPMLVGDFNELISSVEQALPPHHHGDGKAAQYSGSHVSGMPEQYTEPPKEFPGPRKDNQYADAGTNVRKEATQPPPSVPMYPVPTLSHWGVGDQPFLQPGQPIQLQDGMPQRASVPVRVHATPLQQAAVSNEGFEGSLGGEFGFAPEYPPNESQQRAMYAQQLDGMNMDFTGSRMYEDQNPPSEQ